MRFHIFALAIGLIMISFIVAEIQFTLSSELIYYLSIIFVARSNEWV
jgi:hypothetical protein